VPDIFVSPSSPASVPLSPTAFGIPTALSTLVPPGSGGMLSAFHFMPQGVHFETQESGEVIILLLRRHWITNVPWIVLSILLLIIPILILPFISQGGELIVAIPQTFITLLIFVWYLLTFSYFYSHFLLWYFTVSIVTNERIVDIDYINILNKKFAATRISRVEDVTMRARGFLSAFFHYGDVEVQTAGTEPNFLFDSVPAPDRVVRIVNFLLGKQEEEEET